MANHKNEISIKTFFSNVSPFETFLKRMQLFVLDDVSDSNQIQKLVFLLVFDAVTFCKAMLSGGALNVPVCSLKISSTLGVLMRIV